ncbi:MAG: hypothetical protein Q9173_001713 [Seirophora scorigena]
MANRAAWLNCDLDALKEGLALRAANPPTLMVNETSSLAATAMGVGESEAFGIQLDYRPIPILPQAVGGILTQAMFKAYLELGPKPLTVSNSFSHDYSELIEPKICFDVGITMTATNNMTGFYTMTNKRIVTVLSLMGFDFARHQDVNRLREYNFSIVVEKGSGNLTVIGRGTLRNGLNSRPIVTDNRLVWPRCSGAASALPAGSIGQE